MKQILKFFLFLGFGLLLFGQTEAINPEKNIQDEGLSEIVYHHTAIVCAFSQEDGQKHPNIAQVGQSKAYTYSILRERKAFESNTLLPRSHTSYKRFRRDISDCLFS